METEKEWERIVRHIEETQGKRVFIVLRGNDSATIKTGKNYRDVVKWFENKYTGLRHSHCFILNDRGGLVSSVVSCQASTVKGHSNCLALGEKIIHYHSMEGRKHQIEDKVRFKPNTCVEAIESAKKEFMEWFTNGHQRGK